MTPRHTGVLTTRGRSRSERLEYRTREETAMTVDAFRTTPIISRRAFLHTAATATAGLAGSLALRTPPLYPATRTVTMLAANHCVPAPHEHLNARADGV